MSDEFVKNMPFIMWETIAPRPFLVQLLAGSYFCQSSQSYLGTKKVATRIPSLLGTCPQE